MPAAYTIAAGAQSAGKKALAANDPTTFTFVDNVGAVRIISDGSAEIFFTVNGPAPSVDGTACRMIPAGTLMSSGVSVTEVATSNATTGDVVRMISAGTPTVRVERV